MVIAIWAATGVLLVVFGWVGYRTVGNRTVWGMAAPGVSLALLGGGMAWDLATGVMPRGWTMVTALLIAAIGLFLAWRQRGSSAR